jgi:hypothetical protein
MLPNFLCIGTQRSGSTWLYKCLSEHPDVFLPTVKEVSFFDSHYAKGVSYYESFYADAGDAKAVGDVTPGYIYGKDCPARIAEHLPEAKMIAVLRNPIDRAHSAYEFFVKNEAGKTFDEAFSGDLAKLDDGLQWMLDLGVYHTQLESYFSCFPRDQFLILPYEQVVTDNAWALNEVYKFIDVDPDFRPSMVDQTVNVNVYPGLQDTLGKLRMDWLIEGVKASPLGPWLRKRYKKKRDNNNEIMRPETRQKLLDYYREPNQKLGELLDMDVSAWNE